jgi:ATP-dependent DNA helicase PIF1
MDYVFRGVENNMSLMNLYTYASTVYKVLTTRAGKSNTSPFLMQHPQSESHMQRIKEQKESCVVLIGKSFPDFNKEREEFCFAALILLKPWSVQQPLKTDDESWESAFNSFFENVNDETGNPFYRRYSIPGVKRIIGNIQSLKRCKDAAEVSRAEFAIDPEREEVPHSADILEDVADYRDSSNDIEDAFDGDGEILLFQLEEPSNSGDAYLVNEMFTLRAFERVAWLVSTKDIAVASFQHDAIQSSPDAVTYWENVQTLHEKTVEESAAELSIRYSRLVKSLSIPMEVLLKLDIDIIKVIGRKRCLNTEQKRAFQIVACHEFNEDGEKLLMYVGGGAGTGKSEIVKALQEYFLLRKTTNKLVLSASTGTAASKLSGNTIHSLCMMSKHQTSTEEGTRRLSKKNVQLRRKWASVEYLIIDEISMISADLLYDVNCVLQYAKECPDKLFGGVHVVAFGDFFQFPPVFGWPLYAGITHNGDREMTQFVSDSIQGLHLWKQFEKVVILTKNYRQQRDLRYQALLQNHLENGLTTDDIQLLKSRIIGPDLQPPADTQIVVNRNSLRSAINNYFVDGVSTSQNLRTLTVIAEDSCRNSLFNVDQPGMREHLLNLDDSKTDGLMGKLKLFVGMRCMVTANIDTANGLSNGSVGFIFFIPDTPVNERPAYLLLKLRDREDLLYRGLPPGVAPLFLRSGTFKIRLKNRQKSSVTIRRLQFPLVPAYAVTDYKSQGETLQAGLLDIRKPPTGNWASFFALYVLLSRVATLDGLFLIYDFDESVFKARAPRELVSYMDQLRILDQTTRSSFIELD